MKKTFLLSVIILISTAVLLAQSLNPRYAAIPETSPNELTPDFSADPRSGELPLQVQFTDETQGGIPESWLWEFGDGDTSNVQHPVHVYDTSGFFSVKLTVSDSTGSYALIKENFIIIEGQPANCDTLNYPLSGNYTVYITQNPNSGEFQGYVSGNNAFGDVAKANFFEKTATSNYLTGALLDFAIASNQSGNATIEVKAWIGNNSSGGGPVNEIASVSLPIETIMNSIENEESVYVEFPDQTQLESSFFVGVTLPQSDGDTVVLFTNENGDAQDRIGWEKWSNGTWYPYSDGNQTWGLNISNAIFPITCESVGYEENVLNSHLLVYPNPVSDQLIISSGQINQARRVVLYNVHGQKLREFENVPLHNALKINTTGLDQGVYFLRINTDEGKMTRKIVKSR